MLTDAIKRMQYLCDTIPALLREIPDDAFCNKPAPGKWSKKEIVGHLIDSATNNHQRFVRAQFEDTPFIIYDQNNWNSCTRYQQMSSHYVISFWEAYNRHLLELIKNIPDDGLRRTCRTNGADPVTLEWLIEDYVKHMEYHLRQVAVFETDVFSY